MQLQSLTTCNVPQPQASNGLSLMVSIFSIIRSLVQLRWMSMAQWAVEPRQPQSDSEGAHWHPDRMAAWAAPSRHSTVTTVMAWHADGMAKEYIVILKTIHYTIHILILSITY